MRILARYVPSIGAAAALLAACGGPQSPIALPQSRAIPAHLSRSWMLPAGKKSALLYVAEGTVGVYSYPQGELEGQLTGFSDAFGECTDKSGNIYITDFTANVVDEFVHGGTEPVRKLSVPGNGPAACAVDPASGDLAVTDAGNVNGVGANIAIYHKAKGTPKTYTYAKILGYAYCAYDNAGDLFVDGTPAKGYGYNFELAELPHGAKSLEAVSLQGGISWDGGLQWDGQYLAVGQLILPQIQRYTISDGYGTYVSSTPLLGAYEAVQFIIAGRKAIVVNRYYFDRYFTKWDVLVFDYPAGGYETDEIVDASGIVTSVALSR